jgi:hypothetical protein
MQEMSERNKLPLLRALKRGEILHVNSRIEKRRGGHATKSD